MSEQEKLSRDEKFKLLASQVAQHEEERTKKPVSHHKSVNLTHDSEPDEPEEPVKESSPPRRQLPERPAPKKKNTAVILIAVLAIIAIAIIAVAVILLGRNLGARGGSEAQLTVEPSVPEPTVAVAETVAPVPKTGVQLTVPAEYALYGRTEYDLTEQAYQQLLTSVHQYIEGQLTNYTKLKDPYYPDFESISVNSDCSVYTVVVNDARTRTPKERSLPEQLVFYSEMYAAYSQQKIETVSVEYWTMGGNMLSRDSYVPGAQQGEAFLPITEGQQSGMPEGQQAGMTQSQTPGMTGDQQVGMTGVQTPVG